MQAALRTYQGGTLEEASSACPHTGDALSIALRALCSELGVPGFKKKRELRLMHQNFDDWSARLFRYFETNKDHDHALAAVFVLWTRLLSDRALGVRLTSGKDFAAVVQWAVQPAKCEIRVLCGLYLAWATLLGYSRDSARRLLFDLHQPLLRMARFLSSASVAGDYCMLALDHVVDAMINESQTSAQSETDTTQKKVLASCMELVGTVGCELFVDYFHHVCRAFRFNTSINNPTLISNDYGRFLVSLIRYGDAWHRREAYAQLACARGSYSDSRLELTVQSDISSLPLLLSRSMRSYGLDVCDSMRIARTIAQCGIILRGLLPSSDLGSVGVRLFCLIRDDPIGASIRADAATKFALAERPPALAGYRDVDSWPAVLSAASRAVRSMTRTELDGHLSAIAPGRSYTVTYVADVLELQFYLSQRPDDEDSEWNVMDRAFQRYPSDPWIAYAFCVSHAQCDGLYRSELLWDDFIAYVESALERHAASSSFLHTLLRGAIARRAFLIAISHWAIHHLHFPEWRNAFEIADSAAREYLEASAPDGVDRSAMLEIRIVCHMLRQGVPGLSGVQGLVDQYNRAIKYSIALYGSERTIRDTDHATSYVLHGLHDTLRWESRLRAYWPAAGAAEFDACVYSPRAQRETMLCMRLVGEALRSWMEAVSSTRNLDWHNMPHYIFDTLVGMRRLTRSLSSCYSCGTHRSDLRLCSGCREILYCGQECQRQHWVGRTTDKEPHRIVCSRLYLAHPP